jgi:molybdenum cofactor biosynthesis enzyme MoaA
VSHSRLTPVSMRRMNQAEIAAVMPDSLPPDGITPLEQARRAMHNSSCWAKGQQMGSRWAIGCVALEITQRCNLDCTLCYLSEQSEAVKDLPLEEVFRRIDLIYRYYGANTDVQITGGEPTLRKREELIAIVRRVSRFGLRPTLMTNGRKAARALLEDLAAAGLVDVAFHIDTTQRLIGYRTEVELNDLRASYLECVRGLPLSVMFNTTVHDGNFAEIPDLVRFFKANAAHIRTASFNAQAATGRGVHEKKTEITLDAVAAQIEQGAGTAIDFRSSLIGHFRCNRYGLCFEVNGRLYDALYDRALIARLQLATAHLAFDRTNPHEVAKDFLAWLAANPRYWASVLRWTAAKMWQMKADLVAARGKLHTLSFLIHGFMDARALERERIDACVFKTMTQYGPVSMCLHNAKRDSFILQPVRLNSGTGGRYWQPLSGSLTDNPGTTTVPTRGQGGPRRAKGRLRQGPLFQRAR